MNDITDALNDAEIPSFLRMERLVPTQKNLMKGPVRLDGIRPIDYSAVTHLWKCNPHKDREVLSTSH